MELPSRETPVAQLPLAWCGETETAGVYAAASLPALQAAGSRVEVIPGELPARLEAPLPAGQKLGTAQVLVDGELIGIVDLVTLQGFERSAWLYYKETGPLLVAGGGRGAAGFGRGAAGGAQTARPKSRRGRTLRKSLHSRTAIAVETGKIYKTRAGARDGMRDPSRAPAFLFVCCPPLVIAWPRAFPAGSGSDPSKASAG